jgi:FecR-like protein
MRGLPRKGMVAALFMAALFAQMIPATAQPAGDPVARVIQIKGDRLDYARGNDKWYQAYVEMKDYKDDRLRTDATSFGSIEFYTGGQIGINKGTTIEITSDDTANVINLKKGGLWGKLATQPENKPVEIRTSSGVMGIRGTEFVINESEEGTEVAVLEGKVSVTPAGGEELLLTEGQKVYLEKLKGVETVNQSAPEVQTSSPKELRKNLLSSDEWNDFNKALRWANTISRYVPGAGFSREFYWANRGIGLITDPAAEAKSFAASQVNSRVGFGIGSKIMNSGGDKKPDFPTELSPDGQAGGSSVPAGSLSFAWKEYEKADKYFLMLGRDDEMDELVWTYETQEDETSVSYPSDATPLSAGKYFWRVIPLDKEGEPVKKAKAAQTWVTVE